MNAKPKLRPEQDLHAVAFLLQKARALLVVLLFLAFSSLAHAQADGKLRISGRVTDSTGKAIPNVSVTERGTRNTVITASSGDYAITVAGAQSVLVFSSIGFGTQEVPVGNKTDVSIALKQENSSLGEVVVVGYGTQRRREVTSAVTTVGAEQFNKGNVNSVAQMLQGKVAGLSISRPGGDPNGGFNIRLRGLSSLGAGNQPLVVIDGQIGADLNSVDPNDIASIDVLKDASAAAIYGTRGSAGVLIVTTKRGVSGRNTVSYNGFVSAEDPARFTPVMSPEEYVAAGGANMGSKTNWYDEISRTAISHVHSLSLSGGNNGTTYSASINYRNNQGVAINTGFKQLNGRFSLTQRALKNRLVFNLDAAATRRRSQLGHSEAFKYAAIFNPTAPVYSDDPRYNLSGGGYFESNFVDYANPVAVLLQNRNDNNVKRINLQGTAEVEIVKGLKFLTRYAIQNSSNFRTAFLPRTSFHSRNFLGVSGFARGGYAYKADDESFNHLYENTLTFDRRFNRVNLTALGGYSYQEFINEGMSMGAGNFVTDASADNIATALDFAAGRANVFSYKNGSRLKAFFGRVNLNYDNFAFLQATLRREGSTQFGENNRWGMFPAVSAGFDVARLVDIPKVNNLKLRASYGVTGSLPPSSYLSLLTFTAQTGRDFYAGNEAWLQPYGPNRNANPNLKWETKAEVDFGVDFSMFNSRLSGTADYYNRTTSDLIFNVTVPVPPNLATTTWLNIGEMKSKGFELALSYDVLRDRSFEWTTGGNLATYNVELSSLNKDVAGSFVGATNLGTPGQEATQITRAMEGYPIGILYGLRYQGIDRNGKYIFEDRNNDGKIDANDRDIIGNGLPDFEFGFTNTFRYRNFDLNFFLRGSIGHDLINTYRAFYENPGVITSYNVVKSKYYNPGIKDAQLFSSLFVEKASFAKLDNATLGYTFPVRNGGPIRNLRAYLTGQNLFVITNYTGVDPEVRYADGNNVLAPGIDRRETWVLTRTFTFGVNLGF